MPVVPSRQLQVGDSGGSSARMNTPHMKNASHEQMQQLGKSMQGVGSKMGEVAADIAIERKKKNNPPQNPMEDMLRSMFGFQQEANATRVQEAVNEMRKASMVLKDDPQIGFKNVQGKDVIERKSGKPLAQEYGEKYSKQKKAIEETLGTPEQVALFKEKSSLDTQVFSQDLSGHEAEQVLAYYVDVGKSTIETAQQYLAQNWSQPLPVAGAITDILTSSIKLLQLQGVPEEDIVKQSRLIESNAHKDVVMLSLQHDDITYGLDYFEQNKTFMSPEDSLAVEQLLDDEMGIHITRNVASNLFEADPDISEATLFERIADIPEVANHPERIDMVKSDIAIKKEQRRQEQQAQKEEVMTQTQAALQQVGGNWLALPAQVRGSVPAELQPQMRAYAKSLIKPTTLSDASTYAQLTDPEALTKMSEPEFEMLRTKLQPDDFDHMAKQRQWLQKGGVPTSPDVLNTPVVNKQVNNIMKMLKMDKASQAAGANGKDRDRDGVRGYKGAFESTFESVRQGVIRKKIDQALLAKQKAEAKVLTPDEIEKSVGEAIAEEVLNGSRLKGVMKNAFTIKPSDVTQGMKLLAKLEQVDQDESNLTEEQAYQKVLEKGDFEQQEHDGAKLEKAIASAFEAQSEEEFKSKLKSGFSQAGVDGEKIVGKIIKEVERSGVLTTGSLPLGAMGYFSTHQKSKHNGELLKQSYSIQELGNALKRTLALTNGEPLIFSSLVNKRFEPDMNPMNGVLTASANNYFGFSGKQNDVEPTLENNEIRINEGFEKRLLEKGINRESLEKLYSGDLTLTLSGLREPSNNDVVLMGIYMDEETAISIKSEYVKLLNLLAERSADPKPVANNNVNNMNDLVIIKIEEMMHRIKEGSKIMMIPDALYNVFYTAPSTPIEIAISLGMGLSTGTFDGWYDVINETKGYDDLINANMLFYKSMLQEELIINSKTLENKQDVSYQIRF